jgi:hypothetical protein
MKAILTLIFLCAPFFLFCQTEKESKTQFEAFGEKTGTIFEKTIENIGQTGSISVRVMKLKNLITNDKISALSINYSFQDDKLSILDTDEIDGLIKSLTIMKSIVSTPKVVETEVSFKSRSGFEIGAKFETEKNNWVFNFIIYSRMHRYSYTLKPDEFMAFCAYIDAAKLKL